MVRNDDNALPSSAAAAANDDDDGKTKSKRVTFPSTTVLRLRNTTGGGGVSSPRGGSDPDPNKDSSSSDMKSAGTSSSVSSSSSARSQQDRRSKAVSYGKVAFLFCMVGFGVLLGLGSYAVLRRTEGDAAEGEFAALTDRALAQALGSARRDQHATAAAASTVAKLLPDAGRWPFVHVPHFDVVSQNFLRLASAGSKFVFLPLVLPEQADAFEEFAYSYYFQVSDPPFPNGTGQAYDDDGANGGPIPNFGIWKEYVPENVTGNYDVSTEQTRVRAVTGDTDWGSHHKYLTPIFQWTNPTFGLMFDTHSTISQGGLTTDSIIDCTAANTSSTTAVDAATATSMDDPEGVLKCSALTEVFALWANQRGPESAIFSPIYVPTAAGDDKNSTAKLTGFIALLIVWKDVLANLFSESVRGIDCVLETSSKQIYTYKVVNGDVQYYGEGDLHQNETQYNKYRRTVNFVESNLFTENSPRYSLTLYPNEHFYENYSTANPWIAAVGAASIFLITCLLFVLYDYLVGKEVRAKQELLKSKRNFMRFVSHEVRTPLNSVCMGLELLQREIADSCLPGSDIRTASGERESSENDKQAPQELEVATTAITDDDVEEARTIPLPDSEKEQEETAIVEKQFGISKNVDDGSTPVALSPPRGGTAINETLSELVSEITEQAQSAISVLSDILNYDKVEAGKLSLELEPVSIYKLFSSTVDEFRLSAESKGLKYESAMMTTKQQSDAVAGETFLQSQQQQPSQPQQTAFRTLKELPRDVRNITVIGDPVRLQQVMRNYLSNAIKFSKESGTVYAEVLWEDDDHIKRIEQVSSSPCRGRKGGKKKAANAPATTTKEFTCKDGRKVQLVRNGRVIVRVRDTGAGLTPVQLSMLFTADTQFNANQLQAGKGTGLGLFITKGIVEQHGGTVAAESDGLGHGTTFSLTLPAYMTLDNNGDEEEARSSAGGIYSSCHFEEVDAGGACTPRTVLIVDDAFSNRRLLARLLEKNGDITEQAVDGLDCLDKVAAANEEGRHFDMILLDNEMPNLNGPECARKLRQAGCTSLIVGVTGNCLPEDVDFFKSHGADAVIPKPFKMTELQDVWAKHGIREIE